MKRILLVEDTAHLAEEVVDILKLEGYHVVHANNGKHGLEILPESKPDLIITDLLMPGMDGFEFIKQVRAITAFKAIPIIVLSAKTSDAERSLGIGLGANAFIHKPCKTHELLASIGSLMK